MSVTQDFTAADLPGNNCGLCGFRTCGALAEQLEKRPDLIKRCIARSANRLATPTIPAPVARQDPGVALGGAAPTWLFSWCMSS